MTELLEVGKEHLRKKKNRMSSGGVSITVIISVLLICQASTVNSSPVKISVNPGMYHEKLVPSIFYDHFIPVILDYKTPKLNKTEVIFNNWFNCTSEKYPYTLSCPVVFHLNAAVRNLLIDFESVQPGKDDEAHSHLDHFKDLANHKDFCHEIQTHFPGIYTTKLDMEYYLGSLKNCSHGYPIDRNITDYRYDIRAPFSKMEYNFYSSFFQPVSNRTRDQDVRLLASASLSNSRTALQAATIASFYAERNRWNFALAHCIQNQLPPGLVTQTKLEDVLGRFIDGGASGNGSVTSIPRTSITKYFSLPLTDCSHTEDAFVVRLLVPMISSSTENYRLISAYPVEFQIENKICFLKSSREPTFYLFNVEHQVAYRSKCRPNELCNINAHSDVDICASAILSGDVPNMLKNCHYRCQESSQPFRLVGVHKNAFAITTDSSSSFKVSCERKALEESVYEEDFQGPGTYIVRLKSKCEIVVTSETGGISSSIRSQLPIQQDTPFTVSRAMPLSFLKSEFRRDTGVFEMEADDASSLMEDFVKGLLSEASGNPEQPMAQVQDERGPSSHTGLYLYVTFLSLLVGALVVCQFILLKRLSNAQGTSLLAGFAQGSVNITTGDSALLMEECEYAQ